MKRRAFVLTGPRMAVTDTAEIAPHADTYAPRIGGKYLLDQVLDSLSDDKAENIITIELAGKSSMADYMVVASGRSSRQVAAIATNLADRLKQDYGLLSKTEGKDAGDWVLIDTGDVIVHVFRPEVRDFYQIEKMWLPNGTAQA